MDIDKEITAIMTSVVLVVLLIILYSVFTAYKAKKEAVAHKSSKNIGE
ncbi:hypothetical protein [uncultured Kriegella sp.]|tara:strand:- start:301538 stop:301681 length:144 start_codon:yes stop_codon:yes gene_type:complete